MDGYPHGTTPTYNDVADVISDMSQYLCYAHPDRHQYHPFSATIQTGQNIKFTLDVEQRLSREEEVWGDRWRFRWEAQAKLIMQYYPQNDLPGGDIRSLIDRAINALESPQYGLDKAVARDFRLDLRSESEATSLYLYSWDPFPEGEAAAFTYRVVRDLLVRLKAWYVGQGVWCDIYGFLVRVASGFRAMGLYVRHEYPIGMGLTSQSGKGNGSGSASAGGGGNGSVGAAAALPLPLGRSPVDVVNTA